MSPNAIFECVMGCSVVIGGGFTIYCLDSTQHAISHIEDLGGSVLHDTAWGSTVYEKVDLNDTPATDDDLRYIRKLQPWAGVYLRMTVCQTGSKRYHQPVIDFSFSLKRIRLPCRYSIHVRSQY
ncbi:hypothetical protein Pan110_18030 [Gimesia panareensis]|nr:hypothetical protein Pan110_18030 [Gimesia panareensis]